MRKIVIFCLLLSACAGTPPVPCMGLNEVGTVVAAGTAVTESHHRGNTYYYYDTTVTVEVRGVHRVCRIDDTSLTQLQPGMNVNLTWAERKY